MKPAPWRKTEAWILRCSDTGAVLNANTANTYLVFKSHYRACKEADYMNHESPTAPLRDRYVVEKVSI
jgi:hypothetical protein